MLSIQLHSYFCTPEKNGLYFTLLEPMFKGRRNERELFKRYVGLKTKIKWGVSERVPKVQTWPPHVFPKITYTQLVAKPLSAPLL
jgi:hypothetical protein